MADSSGSLAGSMRSWSTTTEVCSNPLVVSAIDGLVYYGVQIGSQPAGVDPRSASRRIGNHRPRNVAPRRNWPELGDRDPVRGEDNGLSRLHFPQYRTGVVAQLSLGN